MMRASHLFTLLFLMVFSLSAEAARVYREGVVARPNAYNRTVVDPTVRDDVRPVVRENNEQNIQDDEWEDD
jgi:hypothetical protein